MIEADRLTRSYGDFLAVSEVSFSISQGEIVGLLGHNGAGKTTLLQILGTLSKQDSGDITMNGIRTDKLTGSKLARFRNMHIGFVFQFHQLLYPLTS